MGKVPMINLFDRDGDNGRQELILPLVFCPDIHERDTSFQRSGFGGLLLYLYLLKQLRYGGKSSDIAVSFLFVENFYYVIQYIINL